MQEPGTQRSSGGHASHCATAAVQTANVAPCAGEPLWPSAEVLQVRLEAYFQYVAATRMAGVFLLNPALRVQALGFLRSAEGAWWQGILITPWFMNLLRLPAHTQVPVLAAGKKAIASVWGEQFEFIGAREAGLGPYEMCSLFSDMYEFSDHDSACAVAQAVLQQLQEQGQVKAQEQQTNGTTLLAQDAKAASRRRFLFGSRRPAQKQETSV